MVCAVNNYLSSILFMLQSYMKHNMIKIQLDESSDLTTDALQVSED